MRTPRLHQYSRGAATLMGNGWLREPAPNVVPRIWDVKSRSALRKCMFMEMPAHLRELAAALPKPSPAPVPAWRPPRHDTPVNRHMRNPAKDARMMPAVVPQHRAAPPPKAAEWWEDPLALGLLLVFAPPIGLACAWTSRRYSTEARWALTVMTTLMTAMAGAVTLALILR